MAKLSSPKSENDRTPASKLLSENVERLTQPRRVEPSGPLGRRSAMDRVVDEHEPHRPVPGSGLGELARDQKNPVKVTAAVASQMITPTASTHGVDPDDIVMRPAIATANPTYPNRRDQTAILQCRLLCSSGGSTMSAIVHGSGRVIGPPSEPTYRLCDGRDDAPLHWSGASVATVCSKA